MEQENLTRYWWPLLVNAHRSENPIEYMRTEMQHEPYARDVTLADLLWMLRKMSVGEHERASFELYINAIKAQLTPDAALSQIQLKSLFIHLCTSVTQLIAKKKRLDPAKQIVSYVRPNEPAPYIWLHTDMHCAHYVRLVKHTFPARMTQEHRPFKVCVHVGMQTPPSYKVRHLALDLHTGKAIDTSNQGAFLQLALLPQKDSSCVKRATPTFACVIILTHGKHYTLQNVYYNFAGKSMEESRVHTLSVFFHSELACK